ncbi:MAG: hypothetical protein IMF26_01520 [Candidatus Fermentithermobacillus carboniphilus]|uniref:PI3K/PI4K catalytic domain-containing protein n=1 Tax=Candidatus Fermentithermobacillus carboniphilus TaxID=3085328 RepID=A0AAT9LCG1_9FIRM|nr:MAG: hypothetical protein IMF26_01520 [Candidatus Fermentithermobacillus carboniphilus]
MGQIIVEQGIVKYKKDGATYFVKRHFAPSIDFADGRRDSALDKPRRYGTKTIPESFFSYGPIEKMVSSLGSGRVNVVAIKFKSEMDLDAEEVSKLQELVGPDFYFSRSGWDYTPESLPHRDPEIALGFQVVFDILVRNWDDGERNMCVVQGVPVWFDFGASLDPRCQNIYRFILKLEEAKEAGRTSSIIRYFEAYSRRRSQILKRAIRVFEGIHLWEIRAIVEGSMAEMPGFFAEYLARNVSQMAEEVDIIRGAFLRQKGQSDVSLIAEMMPRETYLRQTK